MSDADKVVLLADIDRRARALDSRVTQVIASLAGVFEIVLVQATDGTLAADVRPLVRLNVSVIMAKGADWFASQGRRGRKAEEVSEDLADSDVPSDEEMEAAQAAEVAEPACCIRR